MIPIAEFCSLPRKKNKPNFVKTVEKTMRLQKPV